MKGKQTKTTGGTHAGTNWERVKAMDDSEIDYEDAPELDAAFFAEAEPFTLDKRTQRLIALRLDDDVVEWYQACGPGYQKRMNDVLRAFMQRRRRV